MQMYIIMYRLLEQASLRDYTDLIKLILSIHLTIKIKAACTYIYDI